MLSTMELRGFVSCEENLSKKESDDDASVDGRGNERCVLTDC